MSICSNCNSEVHEDNKFCGTCGHAYTNYNTHAEVINPLNKPSFMAALLGLFFPPIGLLLCISWIKNRPLSALSACKGSFVTVALYSVLFIILYMDRL